ncbi:LysR family transcriptional regulator [Rubrobacter aplysinae]|uniref:LysR family transcriptional regulator n=1 Tax=Rubrobacter aplysinae TaxID=909625 RepID=UPI00064C39A4|nr:LysR family transcriptional regulator [Rubrobacter aplysinae]
MELRQLRYFVAVAEEMNFGRAARRLRISQPPLSMQIKALERELGVDLFARTTRSVSLTDAGRAFLPRAAEILRSVEESAEVARSAGAGLTGRLTVGFVSSATLSLLPPAVRLFRERFGGVELELKELTSGEQLDALYERGIGVGLARLPLEAPGIRVEPLLEERLLVALPEGHPLERLDQVPMQEISDLPLVFFTRRLVPGLHEHILELYRSVGAYPQVVQEAIHLQTIVGLVASGVGLAILPDSARRVHREGVTYRPLDAEETGSWLGLASLENEDSLLAENFTRTLREVARGEE